MPESEQDKQLAEVVLHPKVTSIVKARLRQLRGELPNRDELEEVRTTKDGFTADDCREMLGPYFQQERTLETNQFLEMYLAQQLDVAGMAKHIIKLNTQLAKLNQRFMETKAEAQREKKNATELTAKLEVALAELERMQDAELKK